MMQRYGRRNRSFSRSCSQDDVVLISSDSLSQDCHNFTLSSSQGESTRSSHWFDSFRSNSSQNSSKLPSRSNLVIDLDSDPYRSNSLQDSGELDDFRASKKVKNENFDPYSFDDSDELVILSSRGNGDSEAQGKVKNDTFDPYNFDLSNELVWASSKKTENESFKVKNKVKNDYFDSYGVDSLDKLVWASSKNKESGNIRVKKKTKNTYSDPFKFDSSEESTIMPTRKGRDMSIFEFPEDRDSQKSEKLKNVESDGYVLNSSQRSRDMTIFDFSEDGDSQISEMIKNIESDSYGFNSSQKSKDMSIFEFSEDGYSQVSEKFNSSQVSAELENSPPRKFKNGGYKLDTLQNSVRVGMSPNRKDRETGKTLEIDGGSRKSKKSGLKENGVLHKSPNENGVLHKQKNKDKMKKKKKKVEVEELVLEDMGPTTVTLMETQEFGEMMEHVDEVDFALDGLKKGQVKVRRASLLSLLNICGTPQQRRRLKAQGMAKTITDAILDLNLDDCPCNLAAATLVHILTSDSRDDRVLNSPICINFLTKLLKSQASNAVKKEAPTLGRRLLGLCKDAGILQDSAKGTDSSSAAIMLKVQEILINCKEIKLRDGGDDVKDKPELNPKWISLLTMEKACAATISIEDTGTIKKYGGKFKEKLREFGGLQAVFEVAKACHSVMEGWSENPATLLDTTDLLGLETLLLLLKCLKIMENATFLSKDNQSYLLGTNGKSGNLLAPHSFTNLIISCIKILSVHGNEIKSLGSSETCCSMEWTQSVIRGQDSKSSLEASNLTTDPLLLKMRIESSTSGSCSGRSGNSSHEMKFGVGKRPLVSGDLNPEVTDGQDPFAFDEAEVLPAKWGERGDKSISQDCKSVVRANVDESLSLLKLSQQESSNMENLQSLDTSSSERWKETSSLLSDCLLTAVKVLMNISNENSEGCQQIAACGGLETLSSLIAEHFPMFSVSLHPPASLRENNSSKSATEMDQQNSTQLSDHDLDFLVAILGLLVNLVEKDSKNRSRLAAVTVSLPSSGLDKKEHTQMILLLCSIFLANKGAGEAAEEEKSLSLDDEDSLLEGQKEAEKMIVEAYAALLLAFLSTESKKTRNAIAQCLPDQKLSILVPVLERFVEFHMTLDMIPAETHKTVLEVIESCRYS